MILIGAVMTIYKMGYILEKLDVREDFLATLRLHTDRFCHFCGFAAKGVLR